MNSTITSRRVSTLRKAGWLSVASMLAVALLAPSASPALGAAPLNGAIWTSLSDGTAVNANIYDAKTDVYLNGGPQNCGNGNGLPDGDYYFQVSDPSGGDLLSNDPLKFRQVKVVNGVIAGVSGSGNHNVGTTGCKGGLPVQLQPYKTTTNNGGEYSLDLATIADVTDCPSFNADSSTFNFIDCTNGKNDNFKVRIAAPTISIDKVASVGVVPVDGGDVTYTYTVTNPGDTALSNVTVDDDKCDAPAYVSGDANTNDLLDLDETWIFTCKMFISATTLNTATAHGWDGETEVTAQDTANVDVAPPTQAPTPTPTASPTASPTQAPTRTPTPVVTPSPTPFQTVLSETDVPTTTLPPTDTLTGAAAPSSDSWRMLLIAAAVLLASVLVMSPAKVDKRRR